MFFVELPMFQSFAAMWDFGHRYDWDDVNSDGGEYVLMCDRFIPMPHGWILLKQVMRWFFNTWRNLTRHLPYMIPFRGNTRISYSHHHGHISSPPPPPHWAIIMCLFIRITENPALMNSFDTGQKRVALQLKHGMVMVMVLTSCFVFFSSLPTLAHHSVYVPP